MLRPRAFAITADDACVPQVVIRQTDASGTALGAVLAGCALAEDDEADVALVRLGWERVGPWYLTPNGATACVNRTAAFPAQSQGSGRS